MKLTEDQTKAVVSAVNHITLKRLTNYGPDKMKRIEELGFLIAGYAGTGKSVVLSKIWSLLTASGLVGSVVTLTSRAAENLNEKGVPCQTYHSLLYEPILDDNGNLKYFRMKSPADIKDAIGDFILFEEVSFISTEIIDAAIKQGTPTVMFGDDGQLPTIEGESVFDLINHKMKKGDDKLIPTVFLEEIKRTENGSSIPIFCNHVRETGRYNWNLMGSDVVKLQKKNLNLNWFKQNWEDWDLIICGMNKTRKKYNRLVRAAMGYHGELPEADETILCLKNTVVNGIKISNGDLFKVVAAYAGERISTFQVQKIRPKNKLGPIITVKVDNNFWDEEAYGDEKNMKRDDLQEFTFGYALTCHKMQGSEIARVIFVDEDVSFFLSQTAFRYTSGTRASSKLAVVTDK